MTCYSMAPIPDILIILICWGLRWCDFCELFSAGERRTNGSTLMYSQRRKFNTLRGSHFHINKLFIPNSHLNIDTSLSASVYAIADNVLSSVGRFHCSIQSEIDLRLPSGTLCWCREQYRFTPYRRIESGPVSFSLSL